jgi:hypothetical protein
MNHGARSSRYLILSYYWCGKGLIMKYDADMPTYQHNVCFAKRGGGIGIE